MSIILNPAKVSSTKYHHGRKYLLFVTHDKHELVSLAFDTNLLKVTSFDTVKLLCKHPQNVGCFHSIVYNMFSMNENF